MIIQDVPLAARFGVHDGIMHLVCGFELMFLPFIPDGSILNGSRVATFVLSSSSCHSLEGHQG